MDRRPLYAALAITAVFMILRSGLYAAMPTRVPCRQIPACVEAAQGKEDAISKEVFLFGEWLKRDMLMSGPRLLAVIAGIVAMSRFGGLTSWGWALGGLSSAAAFLVFGTVGAHALYGLGGSSHGMPVGLIIAGSLATILVAAWEEICFRGLLFGGLARSTSPLNAALASSAAFTLMHFQALPLSAWPHVFATGFAWCAASRAGASLTWLIFAHWALDVFFYVRTSHATPLAVWSGNVAMLVMALLAWRSLTTDNLVRQKT